MQSRRNRRTAVARVFDFDVKIVLKNKSQYDIDVVVMMPNVSPRAYRHLAINVEHS